MAIKKITQKKQIVPPQKTNQAKPQNPQARAIYDQIMRNQMANYAAQGGGIGGLSAQEAGITPEQLAKLNSLQNQYGENYTQGRLMGAPVGSIGGMPTPPPEGRFVALPFDETNISPEQQKLNSAEMKKYTADIYSAEMKKYITEILSNQNSRYGIDRHGIDYIEGGQRYAPMIPPQPQMEQYQNLLAQQYAQSQAAGGFIPQPTQGIAQPIQANTTTTQAIPAQPSNAGAMPAIPQNNQAMQNYSNLLTKGLQNYAAQTGNPNFGMQQKQQRPSRNISTSSFPTPKPFG